MKRLIILISFSIFLFTCEKKSDETTKNYLVIGVANKNVLITQKDTIIYPHERCSGVNYSIDLNSDDIPDFDFFVDFCYGPCVYYNEIWFRCLTENSKVFCDDTLKIPSVLNLYDTLRLSSNWLCDSLNLLRFQTICSLGTSTGLPDTSKQGTWFNRNDNYIGVMLDNNNKTYLGWFKLSIIDNHKLKVTEIGVVK